MLMQDIPSTGLDQWFKLEARTQRSNIQGRIRLKLWLSTREDRGTSEEDNWGELRQQERLYTVFLNHEMNKQGVRIILQTHNRCFTLSENSLKA